MIFSPFGRVRARPNRAARSCAPCGASCGVPVSPWQPFAVPPCIRIHEHCIRIHEHSPPTVKATGQPRRRVRQPSRRSDSLPTGSRQTRRNRPPWRSRRSDGFAPVPICRRALCRSCAPWRQSADGHARLRSRVRRGDLPTGQPCRQAQPSRRQVRRVPFPASRFHHAADGQGQRGNRGDSSDGATVTGSP